MDVLLTHCAGLDVHKKTVVACRLSRDGASRDGASRDGASRDGASRDGAGPVVSETRTFATMTRDLLQLSDWLQEAGCSHVAMESTGEYWRPIYNILEGHFEVLLVNAKHIKAVPGRKTDVNDAQWLADLLQHGLLRASFVPPPAQRALRDLTRTRSTFIRERATLANRVQKVLEGANIKLAAVASDVLGVSGRAMLAALVAGETDAAQLAGLAKGQLRKKQDALELALCGRIQSHHRLIIAELLTQVESLEKSIAQFDAAIEQECAVRPPFAQAVALLDTIPGVGVATAEMLVSEMGADMSRFPSAAHLASWAGVTPGQHESGGKRLSGRTRQGNQTLRAGLIQAAQAACHQQGTALAAQYHRLVGRRGKKRAIMAVAHSILVSAYYMLSRQEPYRELGADYCDASRPEVTIKRLTGRLRKLGYEVTLEPVAVAA